MTTSPTAVADLIDTVASLYLAPPSDTDISLVDRAAQAADTIDGVTDLPAEQRSTFQAAFALAVVTAAAAARVSQEVLDRRRVFWQGNADTTRDDIQIQKLIGELAAVAYGAKASVAAAAADLTDPEASAAAYLVAQSAADLVTARLFDALGSSASKVSAALNFYWLTARTIAAPQPVPELAATLGARVLGVSARP
ncbi:MAG: hypothetical protein LBU50_06555 [Cellulomonas sp.]|nr:hypothetical protein [Cellulomonas sp.]